MSYDSPKKKKGTILVDIQVLKKQYKLENKQRKNILGT